MKPTHLLCATLALAGGLAAAPAAQAALTQYQVVTTWYEPETQPNNTLFIGSFSHDDQSHTVSNLRGMLSESMTGNDNTGYPNDTMTWLTLEYPLRTWHDAALNGSFAAVFRNADTATFWTGPDGAGDGWTPQAGVAAGGTYAGWPTAATGITNPANAYALIFVPDAPTAALTPAQLATLAYADCAPGGMMGATCMTGSSMAAYGSVGTMGGVPLSQSITAVVPEPASSALLLAGLGLIGVVARRRLPR